MNRRGYSERKRFSVVAGGEIARISMFNERGHEYFRIVPIEAPGYRERVATALELIEEAMAQGCDPGQVRVVLP